MHHAAVQPLEGPDAERRPGMPPKGGKRLTTRVPQSHLDVYDEAAKDRGMRRSDYIAWLLAKAHDLEEPWWLRKDRNQPDLPYDESEPDADQRIGA